MMDRAKSGRTVSDSAINGESINGEKAAMSASKTGDGDFVIEFIECKGKFMDYAHWYFQRFVLRRHRLTADYNQSICIEIIAGEEHELGVGQYEKAVSNSLKAIGLGVSELCSSLGSADVKLPKFEKQPDKSYKPKMSEILRAVRDREMTISSAMECRVSQSQESLDERAKDLLCKSRFK
ncbi:hypothetical protein TRICI_003783 [Trichomonascus ciferrii]|uniref:Uncharacterized protein n=1 Tax=Trichomonascus ciferrii TaxID=44093 RepID=A0A642V311_9ASCO|nr:hypothetical protein TRICI_003783 [Trichomonascus ciferrii]